MGYNGVVKNDIEAETSRERPRFTVDCFLVVKIYRVRKRPKNNNEEVISTL